MAPLNQTKSTIILQNQRTVINGWLFIYIMKIYTKKGDGGKTALLGGTRVPKHHLRICSYGTVDELNSYIGLIKDHNINENHKSILLNIQNNLFVIGSSLASDPIKSKVKIPEIKNREIELLENEIDKHFSELPEMRSFILPGGHQIVSHIHIARCICRRAERDTTQLAEESQVSPIIIQYLNRLSDYLFILARKVAKELDVTEIPWKGTETK